jgi:nickel-dependent lactate racemase
MILGKGSKDTPLKENEIRQIVAQGLDSFGIGNKKVLVIIPDSTRTCPLPLMFDAVCSHLKGKVAKLDFLIALGTHQPMNDAAIEKLVGKSKTERKAKYGNVEIFNHMWMKPDALEKIGVISEDEVFALSDGLFKMKVNVVINAMVSKYDHTIVLGPVFPHEVVGMSGGYKYFFPGICGHEFLDFFHWTSAIITNPKIIGTKKTPVRNIINLASKLLTVPVNTINMVVHKEHLMGLFTGGPEDAWGKAADLAAELDIVFVDKPFKKILSCSPVMYEDIWTAGKCMYKMENVVADGGELIIYAPHITEVSVSHGEVIEEIGYHVRDYFHKQWDKFKHHPWGVVAHSTHVRGIGTFENGVEKPRIKVTLATRISEERCKKINMGYIDPDSVKKEDYMNKENEGILMVPKAGELLYRLKQSPPWATL